MTTEASPPAPEAPRQRRVAAVLVFAILGGPIGALVAWFGGILFGLPGLMANEAVGFFLTLTPIILYTGLLLGFIPALLAGLIYAWLPCQLQRIALAPVIGACTSIMLAFLIDMLSWFEYPLLGAIAATVCATLVRWWGLDMRGAERKAMRKKAHA